MAQPYVGEIRMFAGNFAPAGWMFCEGQLLPISENETLFQLIGTTYGGDGESTFALPICEADPLHQGNGFILAERGREEITLTVNQIPAHTHPLLASRAAATANVAEHDGTAPSRRLIDLYLRRQRQHSAGATTVTHGRQPAAHEFPAVPVRGLHHLAVRDFPVPDIKGSSELRPVTQHEGDNMADPFVAEIRIFPFNFAPKGWAWCDGQLLPLSQNTALFSLLGTTYGGDGKSNFALPDLQGRAPMHPGQGPGLVAARPGRDGGSETVTLLESEIPAHSHALLAAGRRQSARQPAANVLARSIGGNVYPLPTARRSSRCPPGAGARRRRPAAQQPAAVPDVLLLHRAAGRVSAADMRRRDSTRSPSHQAAAGHARRRAVPPGRSTPARAARAGGRAVDDEQKAAFVRDAVRGQAQALPRALPGRGFDVILVDGQPAGRLYVARGPTRSASSTSHCCLITATAASGRRCCASSNRRRRPPASRCASTSNASIPRCGSTSASGSGRWRSRGLSVHGVEAWRRWFHALCRPRRDGLSTRVSPSPRCRSSPSAGGRALVAHEGGAIDEIDLELAEGPLDAIGRPARMSGRSAQ